MPEYPLAEIFMDEFANQMAANTDMEWLECLLGSLIELSAGDDLNYNKELLIAACADAGVEIRRDKDNPS